MHDHPLHGALGGAQNVAEPVLNRPFPTRKLSAVVGISPARVRYLVRRGLLQPARTRTGAFRFSFHDVLILRVAQRLFRGRVTSRRAIRLMLSLRRFWAPDNQLSALRLQLDGSRVMVRDGLRLWDAESGQGVLDFGGALSPAPIAPVHDLTAQRHAARLAEISMDAFADDDEAVRLQQLLQSPEGVDELDQLDSDDWYNLALDLEDIDLSQAQDAYRRAIELDVDNVDAHVNLGRLLQLRGRLASAQRHYRIALKKSPNHQLALYNLGTLLDETDELDSAMAHYQKASLVPDAHYNLARIYEMRGDEFSAYRHFRIYERLMED